MRTTLAARLAPFGILLLGLGAVAFSIGGPVVISHPDEVANLIIEAAEYH